MGKVKYTVEEKLIHRFRMMRDDQKKALEILLHMNDCNKK